MRGRIDNAVSMAPGQQRNQLAGALQRGKVTELLSIQVALVERPVDVIRGVIALDEGQAMLGKVGRDAQVNGLDLARLAFDRSMQAPAKYAEIPPVDTAGDLQASRELTEESVA